MSNVTFLLLDSLDAGALTPLFFVLALLLYLLIVVWNVFLVAVIVAHRALHEPVYVFMCSLFMNGVVGVSSLLPFILAQMFKQLHRVSLVSCSVQMFLSYSYSSVEIFNLAAMAYDRYIAICFPLNYTQKLSRRAVSVLLALVWVKGVAIGVGVSCLLGVTALCRNRIQKVYCNFRDVVSLLCLDSEALGIDVFESLYLFVYLLGMLVFIVFTYIRIFIVCFRGSAHTRHKAASTCAPHLASLANFSLAIFLEESQTRFGLSNMSPFLKVFLSLYIVTGPPLLNSLFYGLNMSKLRNTCRDLLPLHQRL